MADHLEQPRILAVEEDRRNRRLRPLDEPCQKGRPRRIDSWTAPQPVGRSRDAAARKNHNTATGRNVVYRLIARGHIGPLGLPRFGKIDGQHAGAHFRRTQQDRIGEHQIIGAHLFHERTDDDAVQHAEGMVGHDHQRAAFRQGRQSRFIVAQVKR